MTAIDVKAQPLTNDNVRDIILMELKEYNPAVEPHDKYMLVRCRSGKVCEFKVEHKELKLNQLYHPENKHRIRTLVNKRIERKFGHDTHISEQKAANPSPEPPDPEALPLSVAHFERIIERFERSATRIEKLERTVGELYTLTARVSEVERLHERIDEIKAGTVDPQPQPAPKKRGRPKGSKNQQKGRAK